MHLELKTIRTALVAAEIILIRHGELFTPFAAACSQYSTPISCRHALTETVLILSLSDRRLECLFHLYYNFDPKNTHKDRAILGNRQFYFLNLKLFVTTMSELIDMAITEIIGCISKPKGT